MRTFIALLVLVITSGCHPLVGRWRTTSTIQIEEAAGPRTMVIVSDFVFEPNPDQQGGVFWLVGEGCRAPLDFVGQTASLERTSTCVLQSSNGFPLASVNSSFYVLGETLRVERARFTLNADKLELDFGFRIDKANGGFQVLEFKSNPGTGATLVRSLTRSARVR